ncbi:Nn.00g079150.m01.CDS01 [Neocucurbitaria sp. VM-36]
MLSTTSVTVLPIEISNVIRESYQSSLIVTCFFDARWAASKLTLQPRTSSLIETNITDFNIFEQDTIKYKYISDEFKRAYGISDIVGLPNDWLQGFNFNITNDDGDAQPTMIENLNDFIHNTTWGNRHFGLTEPDAPTSVDSGDFTAYQTRVTDFIGTFHGMMLADGMARFASLLWQPYLETRPGNTETAEYVPLLYSNMGLERYTSQEVFPNGTKEDAFSIEFEAWRYGYGYGFRSNATGVSIYIAVSILGIYLLITIIYVMRIAQLRLKGRYTRSQSWEAIPNLIALAENSQGSTYLSGTSAGITSRETWRLNVKVRVMDDDRLSLAFMRREEELGEEPGIEKMYY